ncbi:venom serine protease inhibitor-like [Andrena cerasifolii]|uniref:venom serine protease inhibitor-like n=1 Tax=Andrena cerasifolii TaxID=2819439 RepID=UPI00403798E4
MYRYVVLPLLLVAVAYGQEVTTDRGPVVHCPINEIWSECGLDCEATCEYSGFCIYIRDVAICRSEPGCICVTDYVRNREGVCVPRSSICKT